MSSCSEWYCKRKDALPVCDVCLQDFPLHVRGTATEACPLAQSWSLAVMPPVTLSKGSSVRRNRIRLRNLQL